MPCIASTPPATTPPASSPSSIAAAHDRDLEVWIDVVYNHTTEIDAGGPTYSLRGLADGDYYRLAADGSYIETTGCGNDIDTASPAAQDLILAALDRYADLGADGFRFDLGAGAQPSSAVHRPPRRVGGDAASRMIAEPWDAAGTYQLGRTWPGRGWMQWNDRFRDDVRGFLRGEGGLVAALMQRVQGSPDLFDTPMQTVNFLTCHDGFTMYDLVAYDRKHNEANGHDNRDGAGDNRSWNCGWEGDDGAPDDVMALRRRQLRNAWCLLAMSHGAPMVAMGDEFGRTQGGNNNAYNQDNETSWVDWVAPRRFADLERFVGGLLALRHRHPSSPSTPGGVTPCAGSARRGRPTPAASSRSLAWHVGDLYVIANAYWEPLTFTIQATGRVGPGRRHVARLTRRHRRSPSAPRAGEVRGGGRSVVVLERREDRGR